MDDTLPLHPRHPRHAVLPPDAPFTAAMARSAGIEPHSLARLVREGAVRRLLRGVYAFSSVPETPGVRAAALGHVVAPDALVVDRSAAWVHGVDPREEPGKGPGEEPAPVQVLVPGRTRRRTPGGLRHLAPHDCQRLGGIRLTTPLRTALDLGRSLDPDRALGAMDALLRGGTFTHAALLAELPRMAGHRGFAQLRALAVQVDARSAGMAESSLRLRWNGAHLPTGTPGLPVVAGGRQVRLSLALAERRFGAVLAHQVTSSDLVALEAAGWRVAVLSAERVLTTDPVVWVRHLEREFHQQLLAQTRDEERAGGGARDVTGRL